MRDVLGSGTILGYCTNVHAGAMYEQTLANLETHALSVRRQVSPDEPMGIGLWLSAQAARQVLEQDRAGELRDWLGSRGLLPFTLNGFPHADFHQPVVKYTVYQPDWSDPRRLEYTLDLVKILADLVPEGAEGSISTLPVGWGPDFSQKPEKLRLAGVHFRTLAEQLARVESEQGRLIHVDLEPEPGCVLTRSGDLVGFFEQHVLPGGSEKMVRRHLRVCHDVCHAAVMFEEQAEVLACYRRAGIAIGKVQLSSAIRARLGALDENQRTACLGQLGSFAEDRYLHQTAIEPPAASGRTTALFDDLPRALEMAGFCGERLQGHPDDQIALHVLRGEWRVHFHVPLYLERFGLLETTQQAVVDCLAALRDFPGVRHFEAETYAWSVLPEELRVSELAAGIAGELHWVRQQVAALRPA
jgi:hypothetical protein